MAITPTSAAKRKRIVSEAAPDVQTNDKVSEVLGISSVSSHLRLCVPTKALKRLKGKRGDYFVFEESGDDKVIIKRLGT